MKTIRSVLTLPAVILFAIAILLSSCKGKTDTGASGDISVDESELSKDYAIRDVSEYPLPTAFEVTTLLIEAGAGYIFDICNRVENVDKYITMQSKALNLGVYGADLSYAATYNQSQETMQYLQVSSQLIDELQISSGFNRDLVDRVEKNIDIVDSLIVIISDSFYDTYRHIQQNKKDELSVLVMAGSWIEAIYITSQIALTSQNNEELKKIIASQDPSLTKLLEIMEPVKSDEKIGELLTELQKIKAIFTSAGNMLDDDQLEELVGLTEELRTGIIA
jgi:uncharacterized pyridoxamine 5'-phosphate oxidase family protein